MTFQDYLAWRATNSRWALPRPMDRLRRSGAAQALPAHAHWTDLLAVLEREDPGQDSVTVARPVWRAYKRFQSELGKLGGTRTKKPSRPVPGAFSVVCDAPPLIRLRDLGHEPRRIGRQVALGGWDVDGAWEWCGDIGDVIERRKYLIMLWDHGSVTQFTHFPDESGMRVLFARVSRPHKPTDAYRAASEPVEMSLKLSPSWMINRQPHVGLGVLR
ncbi:MAG: hypothetical protein ACJ8AW_34570 [Rhodopila sp.]|jgi:hypothetical protein